MPVNKTAAKPNPVIRNQSGFATVLFKMMPASD
jgi:hypothetical protein